MRLKVESFTEWAFGMRLAKDQFLRLQAEQASTSRQGIAKTGRKMVGKVCQADPQKLVHWYTGNPVQDTGRQEMGLLLRTSGLNYWRNCSTANRVLSALSFP